MKYKVRFIEIGNVLELEITADGFYMNKDSEDSVTFYNKTVDSLGQVSVHAFSNFISIVKIEK